MPTKTENGTRLIRQSLTLLKQHKRLFVFPVLGYICKYIIFVLIAIPFLHKKELAIVQHHLPPQYILLIIVGFMVLLFVINLILFFFNSAIIENLLQFIKTGKEANVAYGFKCALKSYGRVYLWALYAATYGVIVNLIPRSSKSFTRVQAKLHNNHWTIASLFSLTQVIDKKYGPIKSLDVSSQLVHQSWGERLQPRFSFALYIFLLRTAAFIPLLIGAINGTHLVLLITGCVTVFFLLLISTFYQIINTTWRVVTYCYASEGIVAAPFEKEHLDKLFRTRPY
ncbi:MAG: hypothetical protein COB66_05385 [Coxiella sp. (in: Bacteria)]|nr:MAG: hypothetical protein COB66_05385 [Coxiella sp. (in: g-proteobacteria)]